MNESLMAIAEAIHRLNQEAKARFKTSENILEIKVSPELFDCLMIETHREGNTNWSRFTPSSAHDFKICNVRITPKIKGIE